jgi:hypothetical protein
MGTGWLIGQCMFVSTAGALIGHLLKPTTISRNQGDPFVSEIQKYRPKG